MFSRTHRRGQMPPAWLAFLGSVGLLAVLVALLAWDPAWFGRRGAGQPLTLYCAAGIKAPVEEVAREYEARYGVPVRVQYGGSNTLLANLQLAAPGDLFLPADESYVTAARDKGLIDETLSLASMRPVLAVRRGNPKKLRTLADVLQEGVKLAHANPEAAAVGKVARDALGKAGRWQAFSKRVVVDKPTVNDVANAVQVGAVDAGVVWDVTVKQTPGLEAVELRELAGVTARLEVCVLRRTEQPTEALHFARYLAARDRGLTRFAAHGFAAVEGDVWAEAPELVLYAGAMLQPAIKETVAAFEAREGVVVKTVYNGCGILVAGMRAANRDVPDAFFACDQEFMDQVGDLFPRPVTLSSNQLVILVKKGNPHNVRRLRDLAKPGLRVGIGHEKQCAMGVLTQRTLREDRSLDEGRRGRLLRNVKVESPTGDMLVNQLRTGSLDAAVAYLSNAAGAADELEAWPIDIPCAFATQPFAIGKDCQHQHLAGRLLDALRAEESRERFRAYRFGWKAR